jgi:hypothetical protein
MAVLHRIPVSQGDVPQTAEQANVRVCQWCNAELRPTDKVWECVGNLSHYIVCDECHNKAIIH